MNVYIIQYINYKGDHENYMTLPWSREELLAKAIPATMCNGEKVICTFKINGPVDCIEQWATTTT